MAGEDILLHFLLFVLFFIIIVPNTYLYFRIRNIKIYDDVKEDPHPEKNIIRNADNVQYLKKRYRIICNGNPTNAICAERYSAEEYISDVYSNTKIYQIEEYYDYISKDDWPVYEEIANYKQVYLNNHKI